MDTADVTVETTAEYDIVTSEEALIEDALEETALSAEAVDEVLGEDDPLPLTTIDIDEDPEDSDPVDPDPADECDDDCGADPEDPGA